MKNNKGFFLAETIVMIALVTTIMAFVYPNVSKLYENYKNRVMYYDQTEDLYALRAVYELYGNEINEETISDTSFEEKKQKTKGCKSFTNISEILVADTYSTVKDNMRIDNIYITNYMANLGDDTNYNFNRYLKRIKKSTNDTSAYRLIGVFKVDGKTRYASIKIDNPNPTRNCTNGG